MSDSKSTQELYDSLLLKIKEGTLTAKDRSAIPQQEMPVGDPKERARQMTEVARGYSKEQAVIEANRCLQCKNEPCVSGCPVNVPIPQFIAHVAKGEFKEAVDVIKTTNLLPAICGRVCPQEKQCQGQCTVGKIFKNPEKAVSIGRLERFVADYALENAGKKVAVIGSGPAGLTVAADVRRAGHDVTVFEAFHKEGGVMVYGIPEFRLPKAIVANEVENLKKMGVKFRTNYLVGRTGTIQQLIDEEGFDAAFVGTGAGLPKFMNIPGENLIGVFSANEYLTRANLMKAYNTEKADTPLYLAKNVVVVGGGNFWRGRNGHQMEQTTADYMGMLATAMNGLALQDALEARGLHSRVQTAIEMREIAEPFIQRKAEKHLEKGRIVIFACGTGHPYFTTDTAAVLRATEIRADIILLGKAIDAVYSADPKVQPDAIRFEEISYLDVLNKDLKVMDSTATAMCRDNNIPLLVFGIADPENIVKAVKGEKIGTIVS